MVESAQTSISGELSDAQLRHHYDVEKALAARLRRASKAERRELYSSLYDELYRQVPFHPQLTRKKSAAQLEKYASRHLEILRGFLTPATTFLEIGPGDCSLAYLVCQEVKQVYAVDVSDEITKSASPPDNFHLFLSDGSSIPVPEGSIDAAYSNSLIEHLHPDDVRDQVENIYTALAANGHYVCVTPNATLGPHDVSKHFDDVATGFHLKEYTISELKALLESVGFSNIRVLVGLKHRFFNLPAWPVIGFERLVAILPRRWRQALLNFKPTKRLLRSLLGAKVVGQKPRQ